MGVVRRQPLQLRLRHVSSFARPDRIGTASYNYRPMQAVTMEDIARFDARFKKRTAATTTRTRPMRADWIRTVRPISYWTQRPTGRTEDELDYPQAWT